MRLIGFLLSLILMIQTSAFGNERVAADLVEVVNQNPKIKKIAVIYNPNISEVLIPPQIAQAKLFKVPVKNTREIAQVVNRLVLAQHDVNAIYLVHDRFKAVTNKASVRYLGKVARKNQLVLHSDNQEVASGFAELNARVEL